MHRWLPPRERGGAGLLPTLKAEFVHPQVWTTRAAAERAVGEYTEVCDNRQRLHSTLCYRSTLGYLSTLGYRTPGAFEQEGMRVSGAA